MRRLLFGHPQNAVRSTGQDTIVSFEIIRTGKLTLVDGLMVLTYVAVAPVTSRQSIVCPNRAARMSLR